MKLKYKIFTFIIMILGVNNVSAATSASISVSTSNTTVGKSGTATLTISSSEHIGQIYGTFSCGGLGSKDLTYSVTDSPSTSKSYTISWTAKSAGDYTCKVSGLEIGLLESQSWPSVGVNSKTIKVNNKVVNNSNNNKPSTTTNNNTSMKDNTPKKSSDNYLKSLSIEDASITLAFDKDKKEYSVTVSNEVKKIKINAEKNNSKASIEGTGEKEVKEGNNKFEVVVKAENGDKRTYILNVTVDKKPIIVKLDGKEYTLIKKKEDLPELKTEHSDFTLTIEEQEIPAYRIEKTNYILVALKDSEGKIKLYKFDSYKNEPNRMSYTLYNELSFDGVIITLLDMKKSKIPENYKRYTEKINEKEVEVYKLNKDSEYSLIYGINVETGKENIYKYNSKENTIQIFEREEQELLEEEIEKYKKLIMILAGVIFVLIILVTIGFTRKPKNKEKDIIVEEVEPEFLSKKDIKKIEKETKKANKKRKNKEEA